MEHGINTNNGKASGTIIKKIYESELRQSDRLLPKLTDLHFNYDTFDKMRVYLATQILSESCATAIEKMLDKNFFKSKDIELAKATAIHCRSMNTLFDLMNSKNENDENKMKRGISDETIGVLKDLKIYVDSLEQVQSSKVYWIDGLKLTVNAVIGYYEENLRGTNRRLFTRLLNQDPLENLFGEIRRNCSGQNPYLLDFLRILGRLITTKIDMSSTSRNCEWDKSSELLFLNINQKNQDANGEVKVKALEEEKESDWVDLEEVCLILLLCFVLRPLCWLKIDVILRTCSLQTYKTLFLFINFILI